MPEITKLYESAGSDGYHAIGTEKFYTDRDLAEAMSEIDSKQYKSGPIMHSAIKADGKYYLLKKDTPVVPEVNEAAKKKVMSKVLSKLSEDEKHILGFKD